MIRPLFALVVSFSFVTVAAAACTVTPFNGLTAAVVNPSQDVDGVVDATGCDIGVYVDSGRVSVHDAEIRGALWFGVAAVGDVNDVSIEVRDTWIHAIGSSPHDGAQRGIGVYVRAYMDGSADARLWDNTIEDIQKGGIVTNGRGTTASIRGNTVTGLGPVSYIASNGIQIGYGARAQVTDNHVSGFSYTGTSTVSGGITVVGGPGYGTCPDGNDCPYTTGTQVSGNTVEGSDIGVFLTNINAAGTQPDVMTNVRALNNTITNDALNNMYGGTGYQAGVSDVGNNDKIIHNTISGAGYDPAAYPGAYVVAIDADPSFTNRPRVHANR